MVSNLAALWEQDLKDAEKRARQEGHKEGRTEMIRSMAAAGIPFELIAKASGLPVDKLKTLLQ